MGTRTKTIVALLACVLILGLMVVPALASETYIFLTKWGSQGSGNGQFNSPTDAVVDSSGNVYVLDSGNYRIQKFNSAGIFLDKWGS